MAIEIVDFPINSMVIFHSYVKLPEGIITSRLYPPLWLVTFNRYRAESQWRGTFFWSRCFPKRNGTTLRYPPRQTHMS